MADSEDTFTVNGRRGRPRGTFRVTEPKSHVTAYVPQSYHDRLAQMARQQDLSLSKTLLQVLDQAFKKSAR
jgi:hypothetical protein